MYCDNTCGVSQGIWFITIFFQNRALIVRQSTVLYSIKWLGDQIPYKYAGCTLSNSSSTRTYVQLNHAISNSQGERKIVPNSDGSSKQPIVND